MKKTNINQEPEREENLEPLPETGVPAGKKRRLGTLRTAIIAVLVFMLLCGILYPFGVTIVAKTMFPYEANGSVITVTLADGKPRTFGSEEMGQTFDKPYYLFGRVNKGSPTNISPESPEHQDNMRARIEYLRKLGYTKDQLPENLITSSGSGADPHIFPADAEWQVEYLAKNRFDYGWRLVLDADGNVADYIRLNEVDAGTHGAIEGALVSVAMLEEPIVAEDGSKTFCAEPVTEKLYFATAETEEGLTVLNEYDKEKYESYLREIIDRYTEGRWLWIFGEKTVNVLLVNLALDGLL